MSDDGYITSKDLNGLEGLTGVARKQKEELIKKQQMNEKLLAAAILKVKEEQSKQLKKKKEPKKTAEKSEKLENLLEECVGCLVSLGEKKTAARKIVKDFFIKNPNTKTVDEFINGVFKK